jgi:hypothetical protein
VIYHAMKTSNFNFILHPRSWDISLVCVRTSVPVVTRNARHCVDKVTLHSTAVFLSISGNLKESNPSTRSIVT